MSFTYAPRPPPQQAPPPNSYIHPAGQQLQHLGLLSQQQIPQPPPQQALQQIQQQQHQQQQQQQQQPQSGSSSQPAPSNQLSPAPKAPYGAGGDDDGVSTHQCPCQEHPISTNVIPQYTLVFTNLAEFHAWREKEEIEKCVDFVKGDVHGSRAVPPRFKEHTKLVCARHTRSGRKKYVKKHPERQRKLPSRKLEGVGCGASISYKTYIDSETVRASYNDQHSHATGPENLPFTRRGRRAMASQRSYSRRKSNPANPNSGLANSEGAEAAGDDPNGGDQSPGEGSDVDDDPGLMDQDPTVMDNVDQQTVGAPPPAPQAQHPPQPPPSSGPPSQFHQQPPVQRPMYTHQYVHQPPPGQKPTSQAPQAPVMVPQPTHVYATHPHQYAVPSHPHAAHPHALSQQANSGQSATQPQTTTNSAPPPPPPLALPVAPPPQQQHPQAQAQIGGAPLPPPPQPPTTMHPHESWRWNRLTAMFESVRANAATFDYPQASLAALEATLVRLTLESPLGPGIAVPHVAHAEPGS